MHSQDFKNEKSGDPRFTRKKHLIQEGEKLIKLITIHKLIKVRKKPLSQLEGFLSLESCIKALGGGRERGWVTHLNLNS